GLEAREFAVFEEIYVDHDYDRLADFIPQRGWIVFDVGANVGVFAVQQARRGAFVYAFEPNPDSYRRLAKTVATNGIGGAVTLFNVALGAAPGTGRLVVPSGWTTVGSIERVDGKPAESAGTVTITALDRVVPEVGVAAIDLLKIDTEGAELEVLRGAERTLDVVVRLVVEHH